MVFETLKAVRGSRSRRNPEVTTTPLDSSIVAPEAERLKYYNQWPLELSEAELKLKKMDC
eukprot:4380419-Prymnesium_polylepis.1